MIGTLFGSQTPVNFASWMAFALPTVIVNLFLCWAWLQLYFIGKFKENKPLIGQLSPFLCSYWFCFLHTPTIFIGPPWKKSSVNVGSKKAIKKLLNTKYTELGPMTFQQFAVLVHFIILVALWFFREPRFV